MQVKLDKAEVESQSLREMLNPKNFPSAATQAISCLQMRQSAAH